MSIAPRTLRIVSIVCEPVHHAGNKLGWINAPPVGCVAKVGCVNTANSWTTTLVRLPVCMQSAGDESEWPVRHNPMRPRVGHRISLPPTGLSFGNVDNVTAPRPTCTIVTTHDAARGLVWSTVTEPPIGVCVRATCARRQRANPDLVCPVDNLCVKDTLWNAIVAPRRTYVTGVPWSVLSAMPAWQPITACRVDCVAKVICAQPAVTVSLTAEKTEMARRMFTRNAGNRRSRTVNVRHPKLQSLDQTRQC